jgi:sensor domain CHASE-containing protein
VVTAALAATSYLVLRAVVHRRFLDLEQQIAREELRRCETALTRERDRLSMIAVDWAAWDDTWRFVQDGNAEFAEQYLGADALRNLSCSVLWFVAPDGRVVRRCGPESAGLQLADSPEDLFPQGHVLLRAGSAKSAVTGLVRSNRGPMLVAARPVTTSRRTGPYAGWLVVGRLVAGETLDLLSRDAGARFRLLDPADGALDPEARSAFEEFRATSEAVLRESGPGDELRTYAVLRDLHGDAGYLLRADVPREVSNQGVIALRVASVFTLASSAAIVAVLFVLLRITVERPLLRLTQHAERIGRSGDLAARSGIVRNDEIGRMATAFDEMVQKLADSRAQYAEVARRAGMAEAARAVLHNAGNVLTGVCVSAGAVGEALRKSRVDGLLRGVDLLSGNRSRLQEYLERDERGRVLPEYLEKSAAAVRDERTALLEEAERLQRSVEHAVEIVKRQDALAWGPSQAARESVPLTTIVAGTAALVEPGCRLLGIEVEGHAQSDAALVTDRARLTQILVNLLTNARDAVAVRSDETGAASPARAGRIVLSAAVDGSVARFTVTDNGCGMTPEVLARIFEGGRSSKGAGRGVGLHYCSLAAREMGGVLRAESPGKGLGATFTLELPLSAPAAPAASAAAAARCGRAASAVAGSAATAKAGSVA